MNKIINNKKTLSSSLILIFVLMYFIYPSTRAIATSDEIQKNETELKIIQQKIIKDVEETSKYDDNSNLTRGLNYTEEKEVLVDHKDNLKMIEKSISEPVTIYKEVVTRTYNLSEVSNDKKQASSYKTKRITDSRTYNGDTTTVHYVIGYDFIGNTSIPGSDHPVDAYRLKSSNVSFNSTGSGHISKITAKHHQRGVDLNNQYQIVFNGNINSSDRTNKNFSLVSGSGSANWSKYNTIYSCLLSDLDSGGAIGSFYTVYFSWPQGGGGNYGNETVNESLIFGQMPN